MELITECDNLVVDVSWLRKVVLDTALRMLLGTSILLSATALAVLVPAAGGAWQPTVPCLFGP